MTFEEWIGRELPQLLRFATILSGASDLAEDLVQDVVVKVQQRWSTVSRLDHRDAYVRRMLVNDYLSFRRKFARIVLRGTVVPSEVDDRPHFADQHADRTALIEELNQLPPRQRTILVLRYYDDATIAELLGCRPSTVRAHATRALQTLRITRNAWVSDTDTRSPTAAAPLDGEEGTHAI